MLDSCYKRQTERMLEWVGWECPEEEEEVAKAKSRGISWRSASAVVIRLKVYSSPAADRHKAS